jgi:hypothetical protein
MRERDHLEEVGVGESILLQWTQESNGIINWIDLAQDRYR